MGYPYCSPHVSCLSHTWQLRVLPARTAKAAPLPDNLRRVRWYHGSASSATLRAVMAALMLFRPTDVDATSISWHAPNRADLVAEMQEHETEGFNYDHVGLTKLPVESARIAKSPFTLQRRIHLVTCLGSGQACFHKSVRALRALQVHDGSLKRGIAMDNDSRERGYCLPGTMIATFARSAVGLWCTNACRVVYVDETRKELALAYGTVEGHWLAGEERMRVRRNDDDTIEFSVLSVSRGNGVVGSLLFPFLGRMQRAFFAEQVQTMELMAVNG
mmetsp:Transcript_20341/g.60012  ORF Transcript_20341/g.60012 Transcript_20341/m.60012 type:complete len:274 (-) Transcript_20341:196-1017(-)